MPVNANVIFQTCIGCIHNVIVNGLGLGHWQLYYRIGHTRN